MSDNGVNRTRRRLLGITTGIGAVGAAFASVPFDMSMTPSARARAAGAPVEIDISKIEPGQKITEEWRGKPIWVLRRTPEMLAGLAALNDRLADPKSAAAQQPSYAQNLERAIKPEYLVVIGICTHLGCSPQDKLEAGDAAGMGNDWPGGFFCPCHGSIFDLAGRVYKNVPAPDNLVVPPYSYINDGLILVGVDQNDKGDA